MEKRIENHPILGESPKGKLVKFSYDGTTLKGMRESRLQKYGSSCSGCDGNIVIQQNAMNHEVSFCDWTLYRLRYGS